MALSESGRLYTDAPSSQEVYRVIDDGDCVLTTLDARKALIALNKVLDKHQIGHGWVDIEVLR